jgi:hypothetical protein
MPIKDMILEARGASIDHASRGGGGRARQRRHRRAHPNKGEK